MTQPLTKSDVIALLRAACAHPSSQRKFAERYHLSQSLVSLTLTGEREPAETILNALGLEQVQLYQPKQD